MLCYAMACSAVVVLKFIYPEKATKFCEIWTFVSMYCRQKLGEDFAKILWPSQNIRTLFKAKWNHDAPWYYAIQIILGCKIKINVLITNEMYISKTILGSSNPNPKHKIPII